ncbi:hypothetical protein F5144DRAFT_583288 [Chaetomium tenue]|uniref:Uncharacterized protein n=1 Tax=Chaetomium tenue TaxID=1854479 RepID=A0ACB7NYW8_9PEZI|nr:hypothetical protein F5144DRAFT_583288 [Chaetomium globosum]
MGAARRAAMWVVVLLLLAAVWAVLLSGGMMTTSAVMCRATGRVELAEEWSAVVGVASDISKSDEIATRTVRICIQVNREVGLQERARRRM